MQGKTTFQLRRLGWKGNISGFFCASANLGSRGKDLKQNISQFGAQLHSSPIIPSTHSWGHLDNAMFAQSHCGGVKWAPHAALTAFEVESVHHKRKLRETNILHFKDCWGRLNSLFFLLNFHFTFLRHATSFTRGIPVFDEAWRVT